MTQKSNKIIQIKQKIQKNEKNEKIERKKNLRCPNRSSRRMQPILHTSTLSP